MVPGSHNKKSNRKAGLSSVARRKREGKVLARKSLKVKKIRKAELGKKIHAVRQRIPRIVPKPKIKNKAEGGVPENFKRKIIETNVDNLHKAVVSRNSLTVEEASRMFNVPASKIVEWSNILEHHKLIRMKYPKFGKPQLIEFKEKGKNKKNKVKTGVKVKSTAKKKSHKKKIAVVAVLAIILLVVIARDTASELLPLQGIDPQDYQAYLIAISILIIINVLLVMGIARKRRMRVGKKDESKKRK